MVVSPVLRFFPPFSGPSPPFLGPRCWPPPHSLFSDPPPEWPPSTTPSKPCLPPRLPVSPSSETSRPTSSTVSNPPTSSSVLSPLRPDRRIHYRRTRPCRPYARNGDPSRWVRRRTCWDSPYSNSPRRTDKGRGSPDAASTGISDSDGSAPACSASSSLASSGDSVFAELGGRDRWTGSGVRWDILRVLFPPLPLPLPSPPLPLLFAIDKTDPTNTVNHLFAQFPGPTAPRDFVNATLTSSARDVQGAADPLQRGPTSRQRQFTMISRPVQDHPECPEREGYVRGRFESVEFIREIPAAGDPQPENRLDDRPRRSMSTPNVPGLEGEDEGRSAGRKRGRTLSSSDRERSAGSRGSFPPPAIDSVGENG